MKIVFKHITVITFLILFVLSITLILPPTLAQSKHEINTLTEKEKTVLRQSGKLSKEEMEQMIVDDFPSPWRLACQMIVRDEDILVEY